MMRINRIVVFGVVALTFAACGGPRTVGEQKSFDTVCDKANSGKRVAVEGYLRFPSEFTGTQNVVLRLYQAPDFAGTPIGVKSHIGSEANQMESPPSSYTDSDLKVHTADGQIVGVGTKVKVSGGVYFPLFGQDFTCGLDRPLIESSK